MNKNKKDSIEHRNKKSTQTIDNLYPKKRAMLWLLVLPPYGLYKLIKHQYIHWGAGIVMSLLFIVIAVVSVDMVKNPYRINDTMAKDGAKRFIEARQDLGIGKLRFVERIGEVEYNNQKYDKYNAVTEKGKYQVYFVMENNKEYTVEAVYQTAMDRKLIFVSDRSTGLATDTFPEIIEFLSKEKDKYGEFKKLVLQLDNETQTVETTKGTYRFNVVNEQVIHVLKEVGDRLITEHEGNLVLEFLPKLKKFVTDNEKSIGKVEKVTGYELLEDKQVQYFKTEKGNFRVDLYDDGSMQILKEDNKFGEK